MKTIPLETEVVVNLIDVDCLIDEAGVDDIHDRLKAKLYAYAERASMDAVAEYRQATYEAAGQMRLLA